MASRFESAEVTCVAGTAASTPIEVPLGFAGGILRHFEIIIPAGHAGTTGISLGYGRRGVLPYGVLAYYSGDDDIISRDFEDNVPGVLWSAFVCNTDVIDHKWEVRFDYDEVGSVVTVPTPQFIAPSDILAAGAPVNVVV